MFWLCWRIVLTKVVVGRCLPAEIGGVTVVMNVSEDIQVVKVMFCYDIAEVIGSCCRFCVHLIISYCLRINVLFPHGTNSFLFFLYWRYNPLWVCILQPYSGTLASSRTRFLDHTQRRVHEVRRKVMTKNTGFMKN